MKDDYDYTKSAPFDDGLAWRKMGKCDYDYDFQHSCHGPAVVEVRTVRPSDPSDLSCIMLICEICAAEGGGTSVSADGGQATAIQWNEWIETDEAARAGIFFLS